MSRYSLAEAVAMLDELTENGSTLDEETLFSQNSNECEQNEMTQPNSDNDSIMIIISNESDIPLEENSIIIRPEAHNSSEIEILSTDQSNNESVPNNINNRHSEVYLSVENSESIDESVNKDNPVRGRKRVRDEAQWKENVRKRLRQSGKEYINIKGETIPPRNIRTRKDCQGRCKYKCARSFSELERTSIFNEFWKLSDTEKNTFYGNTTDKVIKARQRTTSEKSRRSCTMKYYFVKGLDRIRVCREFYITTLDISAKRVEYFYKKVEGAKGFTDLRGTPRIPKIPLDAKKYMASHIDSFPRVPSHYCRASSSKEYLDPALSISQMYRLYKEKCESDGVGPQTMNAYRNMFNQDFNLAFLKPKNDRCDMCEEYKVTQERLPILITKYESHIHDKGLTYTEREQDRKNLPEQEIVVCFDMENVIQCPRSNVSNFFYKRKLNVFNMTGHCSANKNAYCVIWNEHEAGRGSNVLSSAIIVMLQKIIDTFPNTKKFILWSDSCVSQNRNSIMCYALKMFLQKHPQVSQITQKFCTPGHSSIQEIDNIHSHIEKKLKVSDIYSPLGVIRKFKQVRPDKTVIIQLRESMIFDYQTASSHFYFKEVPFTKLKAIEIFSSLPFNVHYKTSFDGMSTEVVINRKTRANEKLESLRDPKQLRCLQTLSDEKIKDIKSMLRFMPAEDKAFMKNLCQIDKA